MTLTPSNGLDGQPVLRCAAAMRCRWRKQSEPVGGFKRRAVILLSALDGHLGERLSKQFSAGTRRRRSSRTSHKLAALLFGAVPRTCRIGGSVSRRASSITSP